MARKDIGPAWNRDSRIAMNDNFSELYDGVDQASQKALDSINAEFDEFKAQNRTHFLDAVATVAERDTMYPTPANGDTVRVTGEASYYRYEDGRGWVKTDEYNPAALDQVNQQLADTVNDFKTGTLSRDVKRLRPLVTFYLDDGYQNDYDIVLPKASSLGIPLTICLFNTSALVSTPDRLRELTGKHGWEIHSHTATHADLDKLTLDEQRAEMRIGKEFFRNMGYDLEGICYPKGFTNSDSLKAAREYFKIGMSSIAEINTPPLDTYFVKRALTDTTDMATMKSWVDKIKADGKGWIVFYSHSNIFGSNTAVRDRFFEMMDYVKASGVETVTVRDAMKVYENKLDIGDKKYDSQVFKVGSDGTGDITNIPYNFAEGNRNAQGNPVSFYEKGKVTINKFNSTSPTNIPFDSGVGTLYTDRIYNKDSVQVVGVQTFKGQFGTIVHRAYTGGAWGPWLSYGDLNIVKDKPYTVDSAVTDFPRYKVTKLTFISSESTGFPDGAIGTLEVSRLSSNDILNYQMWYPYNKNVFYKRYWTAAGWSAWEKYSPVLIHSVTHDFGTVNAGSTLTSTFTIPGVGINDVVNVNFQYGVANGVIPIVYVSAADTVVLKLTNFTSGNIAVGSRPLKFAINKN